MTLRHRLERLEAQRGPCGKHGADYAIFLVPGARRGEESPGPAAALTRRGDEARRHGESADAFVARVEATLQRRTA